MAAQSDLGELLALRYGGGGGFNGGIGGGAEAEAELVEPAHSERRGFEGVEFVRGNEGFEIGEGERGFERGRRVGVWLCSWWL